MLIFNMKNYFLTVLLLISNTTFAEDKSLQTQFAQGLVLIQEKNYAQAIPIFSNLIQEHPTLPEAYNNLAFIYATQGNYLKAQETLQAAFKNNPAYALVYENLNAIYGKISRNIYEKAIGAEDTSREPIKNLYLIDHIFDGSEAKISPQVIQQTEKNEDAQVLSLPAPTTAPSTFAPEIK